MIAHVTPQGAREIRDAVRTVQRSVFGRGQAPARFANTFNLPHRIRLTGDADTSARYPWQGLRHATPNSWFDSDEFGDGVYDDDLACEANGRTDADQDLYYFAWRDPWSGKLIFDALTGTSFGAAARCDCPEDEYEIRPECPPCFDAYGDAAVLPKYLYLDIPESLDNPYAEGEACEASCSALVGARFKLINQTEDDAYGNPLPTCVWLAVNNECFQVELRLEGAFAVITILDADGCVLAILRKPIEDFICCGVNEGWESDEDSPCDLSGAVLTPHECTCCPDRTCPADRDEPVCENTPCCVHDCDIDGTIANLATPPPPNPEDPVDPTTACGGMNGAVHFTWVAPCKWHFHGIPEGTGSTEVDANLTLANKRWRAVVIGEDGQRAVYESDACENPWDCERAVELCLVEGESSCGLSGSTLTFTLDLPG